MLILGIESTCDETGAAVVENGHKILSNVVASSADLHKLYGGVFPELACRRHIDALEPVLKNALTQAGVEPHQIDAIAVAKGPGLVGALLIGMNAAKGLAISWNRPLVGVNHVEAHLYASLMGKPHPPLPALGVVLSGGHTLIVKVDEIGVYEPIGTTVDDAIGEAFDKVGTLLGVGYPGGAEIEKMAKRGDPTRFPFKGGYVKKNPLNFSFSGLKTSVLYAIQGQNRTDPQIQLDEQTKYDVAASFQEAAFRDILEKSKKAIEKFPCRSILFGGGVCNNSRLKNIFKDELPDLPQYWPPFELTLDNGAMIAGLGYHKLLKNPKGDPLDLEVLTRIPLA